MKTIFKYPLKIKDSFELELPDGAIILDVQEQDGAPQLWAFVDTTQPPVKRRFRLFGTGYPIVGEPGAFVKTFQLRSHGLVYHLFEIK